MGCWVRALSGEGVMLKEEREEAEISMLCLASFSLLRIIFKMRKQVKEEIEDEDHSCSVIIH